MSIIMSSGFPAPVPVPAQLAYLVSDLEGGMASVRSHWSLGPFLVIPDIEVHGATYRGRPTELTFTVALAQAGNIQLELILPRSGAPSAFTDMADGSSCKLHHMAVIVDDYEAVVADYVARGAEVASSGVAFGQLPFCYVDTRSSLGHMMEIVPRSEAVTDMYRRVREASIDWDGSEPVRYF